MAASVHLICGDVDRDGDVDFVTTAVGQRARLFLNEFPRSGHWLRVTCRLPEQRRDAHGAIVRVRSGKQSWIAQMMPSSSYLASNDPAIHFGLGRVERVDAIEVTWPDGSREQFKAPCSINILFWSKAPVLLSHNGICKKETGRTTFRITKVCMRSECHAALRLGENADASSELRRNQDDPTPVPSFRRETLYMLLPSVYRSCLLLFAVSLLLPATSLFSQEQSEPPPPPPLFSDRTHEDVERFLAQAPAGPKTGGKPGLYVFTVTHIEPGDVLAIILAGCASAGLVIPGAILMYASLGPAQLTGRQAQSGMAVLAVLSIAWVLCLYSLSFARNAHSYDVLEKEIQVADRATAPGNIFIGDLSRAGLKGFGSSWTADKVRYPLRRAGDRIPEVHFMTFQLAILLQAVAPLLVITSRRLRPWSHVLFWLLWSGLVYAPVTYWTAGGGWLGECIDAGSAVTLHVCVGFTALGLSLLRPSRKLAETDTAHRDIVRPVGIALGVVLFTLGNLLVAGGRSLALHPWATSDWLNVFLAGSVGLLVWIALEHRAGRDHTLDAAVRSCRWHRGHFLWIVKHLRGVCDFDRDRDNRRFLRNTEQLETRARSRRLANLCRPGS